MGAIRQTETDTHTHIHGATLDNNCTSSVLTLSRARSFSRQTLSGRFAGRQVVSLPARQVVDGVVRFLPRALVIE